MTAFSTKNKTFYAFLLFIYMTTVSGAWKHKLLKTCFKAFYTTKMWICENGNISRIHITL